MPDWNDRRVGGPRSRPRPEELEQLAAAAAQARRFRRDSVDATDRMNKRVAALGQGRPGVDDDTMQRVAQHTEDSAKALAIIAEFQETQANLAQEQINLLAATADALGRIEADAQAEAEKASARHRVNTILLAAALLVALVTLIVSIAVAAS